MNTFLIEITDCGNREVYDYMCTVYNNNGIPNKSLGIAAPVVE